MSGFISARKSRNVVCSQYGKLLMYHPSPPSVCSPLILDVFEMKADALSLKNTRVDAVTSMAWFAREEQIWDGGSGLLCVSVSEVF
jgi:hypothetical protein